MALRIDDLCDSEHLATASSVGPMGDSIDIVSHNSIALAFVAFLATYNKFPHRWVLSTSTGVRDSLVHGQKVG